MSLLRNDEHMRRIKPWDGQGVQVVRLVLSPYWQGAGSEGGFRTGNQEDLEIPALRRAVDDSPTARITYADVKKFSFCWTKHLQNFTRR